MIRYDYIAVVVRLAVGRKERTCHEIAVGVNCFPDSLLVGIPAEKGRTLF